MSYEKLYEKKIAISKALRLVLEALGYDSHAMTVLLDKDNHHATV